MSRTYKTEGIIIKRINFGETDRLLTIFSKRDGKIRALAKGVRQLKSRRGGNLELFNEVVLFLREGRNGDIINEVELVDAFAKIRKDLSLTGQAFQIAEVVDRLIPEGEANPFLFESLRKAFRQLNQGRKEAVLSFEIKLLKGLGFGLPEDLSARSVENYIEKIIEKKLMSKAFLSLKKQ